MLVDAIQPDSLTEYGERAKPETILVITDGVPDHPDLVEKVLVDATRNEHLMRNAEDLIISIVVVGNDRAAAVWLQDLPQRLRARGAKYDNVDVSLCVRGLSELMQKLFPTP